MSASEVIVVDHPVVQHHLARLRDRDTPSSEFRLLVNRIAVYLLPDATRELRTEPVTVQTPVTMTTGQRLVERVALVPILRAGLALTQTFLDLLPHAEVRHLGLYRDEATATPVEYYCKVPDTNPPDVALVLDPMLATGGSATAALDVLRRWGVPRTVLVVLIAAPEGIAAVHHDFPETRIVTAAVDQCLNDRSYIVPGLGDAGDRLFNT